MKLYYYHDKTAHKALNDSKKDYTTAYIPVMLKNMGFTAYELDTDALDNGILEPDDAVIFGADTLSDASSLALSKAVNAGARAIGLGTDAKRVFPIEQGQKPKDEDEKIQNGRIFPPFRLRRAPPGNLLRRKNNLKRGQNGRIYNRQKREYAACPMELGG